MGSRHIVIYQASFKKLQNASPNRTDSFEIPKSVAAAQVEEAVLARDDRVTAPAEEGASVPTDDRLPNRTSG